MSIKKKIVWLPYDFDTAIGINNEGVLAFDYDLEDIDHTQGGEDIFNGQESVIWKNIRAAFFDELKTMYQELRSQSSATSGLSYENVERMFEEHQNKWPEAIFNEDAWFKYIDPLINPSAGKDPTAAYLSMLQGSKAEQRKWWLYNRFRYIDSKYNAGTALTDYIQIRGYAKSNITITPYATIYPTVKFGSYLVQERGQRGVATTLICPLDNVNDTEIYIYSASQLANVGDLSGFKVGFADFSMATKLQSIKLGDSDPNYTNANLKELYLGNNVLLQTIDIRNCTILGSGNQKTVDISGCANIENVYFDNTQITGLSLPNGGILKVLHLPNTITNLTIRNQPNITDLVANVSGVTTLRIENCPTVNTKSMVTTIPTSCRVRLVGFAWECQDATEIENLLDTLDTMRGLDINGETLANAYVEGSIHTTALTGAQIAAFNERYPYLTVTADYVESVRTFKTYDGSSVVGTVTCYNGVPQANAPSVPSRSSTAQYVYTAAGWATTQDAQSADYDHSAITTSDVTYYAAYSRTLQKYTVTFVRSSTDGGGTLQTISNVNYGTSVTAANAYTGSTPTTTQGDATDYPFEGWEPASAVVQGNVTFTAKFGSPVEDVEITDSWDTIIARIDNGTYKTAYKVGNYKPLDLGTTYGTVNMQIVAMDSDELAGGGTAPLTFLAKELLLQTSKMNNTNTNANGYPATNVMKPLLDNTIYPLIPSNIKERIQRVNKTYYDYTTTSTLTSVEKLWIPSAREMFGGTSYESSGVMYTTVFKNNTARIKTQNGSAILWWLRSADSGSASLFRSVSSSGGVYDYSASGARGVCLGFCLGLEQETISDSWSTILANTNYATDYSIGDTKYLDLGTEGKHLMEIVAFDEDDRADGQGKAGITWISKTLLNSYHTMNSTQKTVDGETAYTAGGWENSDMRAYLKNTIKPLIPETVRNAIVPVTKVQSTYTGGAKVIDGQTTTDDVWIPGHREIFNAATYESTGAVYSSKFNSATNRIKKKNGSANDWWLRSVYGATSFRYVYSYGSDTGYSAYYSGGVALGFCTN